MAVSTSDIKFYLSANQLTGGIITKKQITDNSLHNLFDLVTSAKRTAGLTDYRKVFIKNSQTSNEAALSPYCYLYSTTPQADTAGYLIYLTGDARYTATQTELDTYLAGTPRYYGVGKITTTLAPNDDVIVVHGEEDAAALDIFQDGDTLLLWDGSSVRETVQIDTGGVAWSGNEATIQLTAGISGSYTANLSYCSSALSLSDIQASSGSVTVTSAAGTYNDTTYPVEVDAVGTIYDEWTVTFTSSSAFSVSGVYAGNVGTGTVSTDFTPINPDFTRRYFRLRATGFGGTFAAGDTLEFKTYPSAEPVWIMRKINAGAASAKNDYINLGLFFETA